MEQWRFAEGVWILKEKGLKSFDQFRINSLLNTESKIFFGLLSRHLSDFILGNVCRRQQYTTAIIVTIITATLTRGSA